jgi:hypothetical protein
MSKLTKSDLKVIVKECLIEILAEGIATSSASNRSRSANRKTEKLRESIFRNRNLSGMKSSGSRSKNASPVRSSHLDSISYGSNSQEPEEPKNIKLTSDPILNELLADTARSTLQAQTSAEKRKMSHQGRPADKAAMVVENSTPEEIFGEEEASKWATLAFGA